MRRRELLDKLASLGWGALLGCSSEEPFGPRRAGDTGTRQCQDTLHEWETVAELAFADALDVVAGTVTGQGWDGRLYTDLTELSTDALIVSNDRFYVRTLYPDTLVPGARWDLSLGGEVSRERTYRLEDLQTRATDQGVVLLECAGNHLSGAFGLMSAARFSGVLVNDVLAQTLPTSAAARILVSGYDLHSVPSVGGHSTPGASWSFTPEELTNAGAFIATEMNGEPLPSNHGHPMRLVVPGWYGCACIKWVERLDWARQDAPATSQMMEFAGRTHQDGSPELARDYRPALIEQAAMPIRIEHVRDAAGDFVRIVGIAWGGMTPLRALELSTDGGATFTPVDLCPVPQQNRTWTLWWYLWEPTENGTYSLTCRAPGVPAQRLDERRYQRTVEIGFIG